MDVLQMSSYLQARRLETWRDGNGDRSQRSASSIDTWRPTRTLGRGTFGEVWQEQCISGPSQNASRAVKQIRKQQYNWRLSQRALEALFAFSDERVHEFERCFVRCFGWFDDAEHLYIAMEFMQHGDLQSCIGNSVLPEPEAAIIISQVSQALQYMHRNYVVHRDLQPSNILVYNLGPRWHVKVADIRIAKNTDGTPLGASYISNPGYLAPELLDDSSDHYTKASDVWALGAVAYWMRTGFPPFPTYKALIDYVHSSRPKFPVEALGASSDLCMNFVFGAMNDVPIRRSSVGEILAHAWLSKHSAFTAASLPSADETPGLSGWDMGLFDDGLDASSDGAAIQEFQSAPQAAAGSPPQYTSWPPQPSPVNYGCAVPPQHQAGLPPPYTSASPQVGYHQAGGIPYTSPPAPETALPAPLITASTYPGHAWDKMHQ